MNKKDLEQITDIIENSTYIEHFDYTLEFCDNEECNDIELIFYLDDCDFDDIDDCLELIKRKYSIECIDRGRYLIIGRT